MIAQLRLVARDLATLVSAVCEQLVHFAGTLAKHEGRLDALARDLFLVGSCSSRAASFGRRLVAAIRRRPRSVWAHLAHQREALGVVDALDREVDVEIGPVEMMRVRKLNVAELANRHFAEPGEVVEGEEALAVVEQQPEAVLRDVGDFNDRSAFPTRGGFHLRAPGRGGGPWRGGGD